MVKTATSGGGSKAIAMAMAMLLMQREGRSEWNGNAMAWWRGSHRFVADEESERARQRARVRERELIVEPKSEGDAKLVAQLTSLCCR